MHFNRLVRGRVRVGAGLLATVLAALPVGVQAHRDHEARLVRLERVLSNRALLDMQGSLAALERELRALRGEIELQNHRIAGLERELAASRRAAAAPATAAAPDAAAEQAAYREAFARLQARDFEGANGALAQFLERFPDGRLAPNAIYWLGESHFALGEYAEALTRFETVVTQHPDTPKFTNALLKLGFAHDELGNGSEARRVLEQLLADHPNSEMAALARKRLRNLKSG